VRGKRTQTAWLHSITVRPQLLAEAGLPTALRRSRVGMSSYWKTMTIRDKSERLPPRRRCMAWLPVCVSCNCQTCPASQTMVPTYLIGSTRIHLTRIRWLISALAVPSGKRRDAFCQKLRHDNFVEARAFAPVFPSKQQLGGKAGVDYARASQEGVKPSGGSWRVDKCELWRFRIAAPSFQSCRPVSNLIARVRSSSSSASYS